MEIEKMMEFLGKKFKKNGYKSIIFTVDNIHTVTDIQGNVIKRYFVAYNETIGKKIYDYEIPISTVTRGLISC